MAVKIRWRLAGFREIRTLSGVQAELDRRADAIATSAGPGYVTSTRTSAGRGRARTAVITGDAASIRDNARNHTLVRALGQAKGGR